MYVYKQAEDFHDSKNNQKDSDKIVSKMSSSCIRFSLYWERYTEMCRFYNGHHGNILVSFCESFFFHLKLHYFKSDKIL